MPALDGLPNEVLHGIASCLVKKHDLVALSKVSKHCYQIANPILWRRETQSDRPGALHWAADHGDLKLLQRALRAGVDPNRLAHSHKPRCRIESRFKWWNYHSTYFEDPSWRLDDDDQSVDLDPDYLLHERCNCFAGGCDDGVFNDCNWQAIHTAASKGRIDMIEALLENGASIDGHSWGFCVCRPHLPMDAFRDARSVDEEELEDLHGAGWTPLHIAICYAQTETAKYLLKKGASTTIYQGIDVSLLMEAWEEDEEPRDPNDFNLTALHHAAKHNRMELLEFIIDGKFQTQVDCEATFMGTPLIQAIWYKHWDTAVPFLLKHGAGIDMRLYETRLTPLMMACLSHRYDDAVRLIDFGADVASLAVHQFSILHLILGPGRMNYEGLYGEVRVSEFGNKTTEADLIRKFVENGFPVDAVEALLGMTPLMIASSYCNIDAMRALIDGGAQINASDEDGQTALSRVGEATDGHALKRLVEAAQLLLDSGADVRDQRRGATVLNAICNRASETRGSPIWEEQHVKLAKLLIESGADPNSVGTSNSRAVSDAILRGNFAIAQAVLDGGGRPLPNELEAVLEHASKDMNDSGKTKFIVSMDFEKYGLGRPSEEFLVNLITTALQNHRWGRAGDLAKLVSVPEDLRKGLLHRCLREGQLVGDDPSPLLAALFEAGQDPNELMRGEPAILLSFRSSHCWRTTPLLVDAGADVWMTTPRMPDGALLYSLKQGFHTQTLQILSKNPDVLQDQEERIHIQCWESIVRWGTRARPGTIRPPEGVKFPFVYWNLTRHLLDAGLRTDVTFSNGATLRSVLTEAMSFWHSLGPVERAVLDVFDIEYTEPPGGFAEASVEWDADYATDWGSDSDVDRESFSPLFESDDEWTVGQNVDMTMQPGLRWHHGLPGLHGTTAVEAFNALNGLHGANALDALHTLNALNGLQGTNPLNALNAIHGLHDLHGIHEHGLHGIHEHGLHGIHEHGLHGIHEHGLHGIHEHGPHGIHEHGLHGIHEHGLHGINYIDSDAELTLGGEDQVGDDDDGDGEGVYGGGVGVYFTTPFLYPLQDY